MNKQPDQAVEPALVDKSPLAVSTASRSAALAKEPYQFIDVSAEETIDLGQDYGRAVLPENIISAVEASLDQGETHYPTRLGLPGLVQAIAHKLSEQQGLTLDPASEVIITSGGREALYVAIQALLQPGDQVLVPELRSPAIDAAVLLARGEVVPIPLSAAEGFQLQAERMAALVSDRTRMLILVNPANPTGTVIPDGELARIADLAHEHDLTILSDESLDGSLHSIASYPQARQRTLVIGSFSYLYNMASWRIGFAAGASALSKPTGNLKRAISICSNAMSQYAALEAMTGPQDWLAARLADLDAKRDFVLSALGSMGLAHSHAEAGPYVWVDGRSMGPSPGQVADWLLAQHRIAMAPGTRFGPAGRGYLRLSLWPSLSTLAQAMQRLRAALTDTKGGAR